MVIQINSQVLYYEHYTDNQIQADNILHPLLFIHGNGEDHHIWDELADALKDRYEIYTVDSRCHGLSAASEELHYQDMADDFYNFIIQLKIDHPLVIGFSDGGITALLLAISHSDAISGIITCGANTSPKNIKHQILKEIRRAWKEKTAEYKKIQKAQQKLQEKGQVMLTGSSDAVESAETPAKIFERTGKLEGLMLAEPDITAEDLSSIRVPAVIMAGENDAVKESDTSFIADNIPDSRMYIISGEGHDSYVVHSTFLKSYIEHF